MITIKNYEQYFLLYTDGELSELEMDLVQDFADAHPQLAEELEMLMATKLETEDTLITNFNFASLYKNEEIEPITTATLIDLLHGEIAEPAAIESEIEKNKALREEWDLLKRTTLVKDPIVFAHKQLLYKNTSVVKPIFNMWRMVAAALFIGLMLLGGYKYFTKDQSTSVDFVKTNDKIKDTVPNQIPLVAPTNQTDNNSIATNENKSREENVVATKTNTSNQEPVITNNQTDNKLPQRPTTKSAEDDFIVQKPTQNKILDINKKESFQKENILIQNSVVAAVNTKKQKITNGINKVEIIDVDLSKVFAETAMKASKAASLNEDESTVLYVKTSKLKDTKVGMAFSKLKKIAKSKIGIGDDASISFHPIVINL